MRQEISDFLVSLRDKYGYLPKFAHNLNPDSKKVCYGGPLFGDEEIGEVIESLLFGSWAVNGSKTLEFENSIKKVSKEKFATICNSGSSANLILLAAAKEHFKWKDGDEIVVSPCGFATTVSTIGQNNLMAVFADIEFDTLNFDLDKVEKAITQDTRAIFVSPVLGNSPDLDRLKDIATKHNIVLLLDCCDSFGSKWDGVNLQKHFFASSYSFYPAHHITTLMGGAITSDNKEFMEICRELIGWGRGCYCSGVANLLPNGVCGKRFSKWLPNYDGITDHKYLFNRAGYNLQMTDLQAAIGVEQLKKFDKMEKSRREVFDLIFEEVRSIPGVRMASKLDKSDPSWFGVPIICQSKDLKNRLVNHFESNGIQTRGYFSGNLLLHPGFSNLGDYRDYPLSNKTLDLVFFLGSWPGYSKDHLSKITSAVRSFDSFNLNNA